MKKKYIPLKYVLGMAMLFVLIPILCILLIIFVIGFSKLTITISMFLGVLIISGPIAYFKNQENASVVFENDTITNYMNDGTSNFGWTEEIKRIKRIELVDNNKAKEYFKNCKSNKVLLLDFGAHNVKYISVGLFTKAQIDRILMHIEKIEKTETGDKRRETCPNTEYS